MKQLEPVDLLYDMQEAYIAFNGYLHFSLPLQRDVFNPTSSE